MELDILFHIDRTSNLRLIISSFCFRFRLPRALVVILVVGIFLLLFPPGKHHRKASALYAYCC